jgi:hypothetical protein
MTYPLGLSECPCKKKKCPRHGNCEECIPYHKNKGQLPYCERKSFLKKLARKNKNS